MSKKRKRALRRPVQKREQRQDPWRWIPALLALVRFGLWLGEKHSK